PPFRPPGPPRRSRAPPEAALRAPQCRGPMRATRSIRMKTPAACLAALVAASTTPALAQETMDARAVFDQAQAICEADGGELWGVSLCGPILIVDPSTRRVTASRAGEGETLSEQDGVFAGDLPADMPVANTAVEWDGVRWTMLVAPLPD